MQMIQLTEAQLLDYSERIVIRTLQEVGAIQKKSEFIYRPEMIAALGSRRKFDRAVASGKIEIFQEDHGRCPRMFADRAKFESYILSIKRSFKN